MIDIDKAFENRWRIKSESHQVAWAKGVKALCRDFFEAGIALSEPQSGTITVEVNVLEQRAKKFCDSLNTLEYIQKYGIQMLKDFYDYWTEPNPSNTKMRFEMQKTWDLNRRLARWARNNFNRYDRQQSTNQQQQQLSKLADILTD